MPPLQPLPTLFSIETYGELKPHDEQEWLLTNGLGSFACSTIVGMNTRRYHGLFCAATTPPVGRIMTVNRIGELLTFDNRDDQPHELSINAFHGSLHPRGDQYLTRFELGESARWEFEVDGVKVSKELRLLWMNNVAAIRYRVEAGDRPFRLQLLPFVSLRDYHALRRSDYAAFHAEASQRQVTVAEGPHRITLTADAGSYTHRPDWWYGHWYPVETERGQDDTEDLYTPGQFVLESASGETQITLWMTLAPAPAGDWDAEIGRRRAAELAAATEPENAPVPPRQHPVAAAHTPVIHRLHHAANDFLAYRKTPSGEDGTTILAGFPWFTDWGRDTMISLPGLLLSTRHFRQARQVLSTFAQHVSQGMIPNRFDDYTNEPSYNTVDASLWFIHAVFQYRKASGDEETFARVLRPACQQILDGYKKGTRYYIKMDPADGLICQGDIHTQLTWMDAKCNGIAFTPRQGKPVEINALWHNALVLMGEQQLAQKVAGSFVKQFWISPFRGLADVVDGDRRDASIRPNQIFAVSVPNCPLNAAQQSAVVEVVRRELLTPMGLRTLSRSDPNYKGRYTGPQMQRDAAYHNGTVWPWLIGAFLEAYLKVNSNSEPARQQARAWLSPLVQHMSDTGCLGQISEIFDGDEPHRPVGCFAQAWSVAEVLRLAMELGM